MICHKAYREASSGYEQIVRVEKVKQESKLRVEREESHRRKEK
jgi:heptaprenylglyceryl phosphate synthase